MTHVNPILNQNAFRGRVDSGNEATPTWIALANTDWSQNVDEDFRVRFVIQETANSTNAATVDLLIEYSLNSGAYAAVTASTPIQFGTFTGATDNDATTQQLGAGTFVTGRLDSNGTVTSADLQNSETEYEYCLFIDSAQVVNADTIDLRVYDGTTALDNYTQTPRITVVEAVNVALTVANGGIQSTSIVTPNPALVETTDNLLADDEQSTSNVTAERSIQDIGLVAV